MPYKRHSPEAGASAVLSLNSQTPTATCLILSYSSFFNDDFFSPLALSAAYWTLINWFMTYDKESDSIPTWTHRQSQFAIGGGDVGNGGGRFGGGEEKAEMKDGVMTGIHRRRLETAVNLNQIQGQRHDDGDSATTAIPQRRRRGFDDGDEEPTTATRNRRRRGYNYRIQLQWKRRK